MAASAHLAHAASTKTRDRDKRKGGYWAEGKERGREEGRENRLQGRERETGAREREREIQITLAATSSRGKPCER